MTQHKYTTTSYDFSLFLFSSLCFIFNKENFILLRYKKDRSFYVWTFVGETLNFKV